MKSNNLFKKIVATATVVTFVMPVTALAQTRLDVRAEARTGSEIRAEVRSRICSLINTRLDLLDNQYGNVRDDIREQRDKRRKTLSEKREERNDRVKEHDDKADTRRTGLYARLDAQAKTDAQKTALATFITTVDTAVQARRVAFDSANATFRTTVNNAVDTRYSAEETVTHIFRTAISEAVLKAQQSCHTDEGGEDIRVQFQADIEAARVAFREARETVLRTGVEVREATKIRNDKHTVAITEFKIKIKAAGEELKASFSSKASQEDLK